MYSTMIYIYQWYIQCVLHASVLGLHLFSSSLPQQEVSSPVYAIWFDEGRLFHEPVCGAYCNWQWRLWCCVQSKEPSRQALLCCQSNQAGHKVCNVYIIVCVCSRTIINCVNIYILHQIYKWHILCNYCRKDFNHLSYDLTVFGQLLECAVAVCLEAKESANVYFIVLQYCAVMKPQPS